MLNTLILTPTGSPRPGLRVFLRSIPALRLCAGETCAPVDLLIFDAYAPEYDGWSVLRAAKAKLPARHCLALVGSPHQIADALAAGADSALLTGFSTAEFLQKLTELFPQEE